MWSTAYYDNAKLEWNESTVLRKKNIKAPIEFECVEEKRTRQDPVNKKLPLI
jgi:hypothetical protein